MTATPREYTHGCSLAPMAGFSDSAFRIVCRRLGATSCVTEMVSVQGLSRKSAGSCRLLAFSIREKPIGVQLYGSEPVDFERAACTVSGMGFDFIDINAGCPVRKVLASRSGAALLLDVPRLLDIVSATSAGAGGLPVTLKIRLGWDPSRPLPRDIGAMAAARGASALAVHGRYRPGLVEASPVPVVANGDSTSPAAALRMRDSCGATGILVGRGAIGRPWFFRAAAGNGPLVPEPGELATVVLEHLSLMRTHMPEPFVFHAFRGQLVHYLKGFRGAASLRSRAVRVESEEDVRAVLEEAAAMSEAACV